MDVSIIIINYNTKDILKECLTSLSLAIDEAKGQLNIEVIVVDNGSVDGSGIMINRDFPEYKLIANKDNLGFSKANNLGIKIARGKYILLLNSDTKVFPGTIPKIYKFMEENPNAGVSTCQVELTDGSLDPACHRGFPTPWASFCYFTKLEKLFPKTKFFSGYHQYYKDLNTLHEIDSPSGAFYFIRKKTIDSVGLLDEDYFMYGEDLDWSYRIKKKGWTIYYFPFDKILHYKKQSGRLSKDYKTSKEINSFFYQTMELFYQKHYFGKYPWLLNKIIISGIRLLGFLNK